MPTIREDLEYGFLGAPNTSCTQVPMPDMKGHAKVNLQIMFSWNMGNNSMLARRKKKKKKKMQSITHILDQTAVN